MLPRTIRVKFKKTGVLIFISHLDLMRFMTRALVRAGIPVVYTEGFNPHPKLTFGLPLSVGTSSECELMEFKICQEMACEEILSRLRANLPETLEPLSAYEAPQGVKLSSIAFSEYVIGFDHEVDASALASESIVVLKQTKSGEKAVDIKPLIRSFAPEGDRLTVVLCADSQNYCNPELIVKVLGEEDYTIHRTKCFGADGETEFR